MNKKLFREVSGVLILDKPKGSSSNWVLQKVRRLYSAKKAGHTGSLDPLASGLLPICFGEATKFSQFLLDADKVYRVVAKLGVRTTTGDLEGDVVENHSIQMVTDEKLSEILDMFRGDILQVPPMYSALKYQGNPLYKLARKGQTVERPARAITIYELMPLDYQNGQLTLEVRCSKGTYIRTLVEDIGQALGCGACVGDLRRLAAGPYREEQMVSLSALEALADTADTAALEGLLLPIDSMLPHLPRLSLSAPQAKAIGCGQRVVLDPIPAIESQNLVRLYREDGPFLGIAEMLPKGELKARRLLAVLP